VICAEAGLTVDAAFNRVAGTGQGLSRTGRRIPADRDRTGLPDRTPHGVRESRQRVKLDAVKGVVTTMIQTEKYGTPLASALRVLSAEFRNERMMRAEEKAARLPAIMTMPLILFILPRPRCSSSFLGILSRRPARSYGYIALGEPLAEGVNRVARFVEKPDEDRARAMLAQGGHVWNAGIFLFSARAYLDALAQHQPEMLAQAQAAMAQADRDGTTVSPSAVAFAASPAESIDVAVMERAANVACVPVSMGWSDVGSFDVLHDLTVKDDAGNALRGSAYAIEAGSNFVLSQGPSVTLVGVENLIVIATGDEILILPRGASQHVRKAAALAKSRKP
jgi:hypothetical protein